MKGKHRNMWRSVIALVLTFTLVFGTVSTAFATTGTDVPEKETINYVSLGDSTTNGFGLDGYEYEYHTDAYEECTDINCTEKHEIWHWSQGYKQVVPTAYPAIVAENYGWNLEQLAMSCMRMEDLNWVLNYDNEDPKQRVIAETWRAASDWNQEAWNEAFVAGDWYTFQEFIKGRFTSVYPGANPADIAAEYQTAIENADVINIGSGNSNFGVFLLGRLMNAIGFGSGGDSPDLINLDNAMRKLDAPLKEEFNKVYEDLIAEVMAAELPFSNEQKKAMADAMVYTMVSFVLNYEEVVTTILEKNSDAEIIVLGLINPMNGMVFTNGDSVIDVGAFMRDGFSVINAYLAGLPTVMQAKGKYPDARIYYAENMDIHALVYHFADEIKTNPTIRDRFITEIVGDDGDGMVWELMKPMVGGFVPGASLVAINRTDIEAVENADGSINSEALIALAANNNTRDMAISIALYLAFEDAICESTKEDSSANPTIDGVLALGNLNASVFSDVIKYFEDNIGTTQAKYIDEVAAILANSFGMSDKAEVLGSVVKNGVEATVKEQIEANPEAIAALPFIEQGLKAFGFLGADEILTFEKYWALCEDEELGAQIRDSAAGTIYNDFYLKNCAELNYLVDNNNLIGNVNMLCMLRALPETLSAGLQSDDMIFGLLQVFARCLIGNGLGAHPCADTHTETATAIIEAYDNGYMVQDETINNLIYVITEYYDEAYAYAYEYAKNEGYIDATIDGIDDVEKTLKVALDEAKATGMSDELKAELEAAYEGAMATTAQLKKLINEADVLDEDTYNEAVALMAALEQNLNDFCSVAEQVGVDTVKQLKKAYEYLKPIVIEQLKIAIEKGTEWLMKKIGEAYDAFVEWLINEGLPGLDKALYDWLYENPEIVIGFFYYYGDDLAPLVDEYGDEVLQILLYVLSTYGPDAVEWALENPEEAIAKWVQWYNKHGHKVWPMIDRYLETLDELGAFDGLKAAVEELEAYVIAYAEKVVAELQAMYDELNEAAQAALEDLIAAIEAAKNGADNAVAEIMAALEELYDAGVAIYKGATSGYYTVTDDSYYVALGDTDVEYAQIVADEMKLDGDQFVNAGVDGLRAEDLRMILDPEFEADAYGQGFGDVTEMRAELIEEIEKSDLITLGFSNNTITEFAAAQIAAMIAGEEPVAMDWARLIGKDGAAVMAKTMTEIKAALMAEGVEAEVVELVAAAIESYAYACTGFTCSYPEVVELIKDINPETQVVVVGMYNPFENAVLDLEGTQIPVGDFVGMLVDLVNVYYTSHAILTGDAIYVNAPAVETQAPFDAAMGIEEFVAVFADLNSLEPSAAGHEYIAEQIMSVMNVVDKDAFNTLKYIEQIKNFGEVTRDNLADAKALAEAARQAWDSLTDEEKALVGLDNYKVLVDFELEIAKVELGIAEDIEAAEKALAEAEAKAAEIERALKITESTVANLKAKVVNKSQIKVTWEAAEVTPDQYRVTLMKAGKKAGTYWVAGDKETVTLKNVLRGANFTVRVTPVAKVDGKKYFSIYKTSNKVKTQLQKANLTVKKAGAKKQIISKDQNSTGFQIYISKDKNFKKNVKKLVYQTNKKGLNVKVKAKNFKKGTNYVKVRAYTKVNGKTVYGAWSGAVKVTK